MDIDHRRLQEHRIATLLGVLTLHAVLLGGAVSSRFLSAVSVPVIPPRLEVRPIELPRTQEASVHVPSIDPMIRAHVDPPPLPPMETAADPAIEGPLLAPVDQPATPAAETIAGDFHPASMDPAHPLHIGPEYYPPSSVRLHEQGRCRVLVRISREGRIEEASLEQRTGYARLDAACLAAVKGQRMSPATVHGRPVDSKVSIPINWLLAP